MKNKIQNSILPLLLISFVVVFLAQQSGCSSSRIASNYPIDTLYTNQQEKGKAIQIIFMRGEAHNHPLMAVWITDTNNQYIETLYIAESIAKGVFGHGDKSQGKWMPGAIRRPAALPVWSHNRGIKENDGLYIPTPNTPMPDAISGATPPSSFMLNSIITSELPEVFYVYFEINQTWDWNEFWTNNKFPDDEEYKTSCQPALVYQTVIDSKMSGQIYEMNLIGHSHYSGKDGKIYTTLETITSAKNIGKSIRVKY